MTEEKNKKLKMIQVPISKVLNWDKNKRNIKTTEMDRLKRQIQKLGIYKPLVGYEEDGKYIILGGNMRLRAIRALGHEFADVVVVEPKDEAHKLMINLSDNDRAGEYDEQGLAELAFEQKDNFPFEDFKFDAGKTSSIESLLRLHGVNEEAEEEDMVPKADPKAETKHGDIFELGPHRLICGDATEKWPYEAIMQGEKADLVFTDPPYNVAYEGTKFKQIMNDDMDEETFIKFTLAFMAQMEANTKTGGVFYICSGYSSYPAFIYGIKASGMVYSGPIIWVKNQASMGWEDYKKKHEMILKAEAKPKKAVPILYGWNKGAHYFVEDKYEADVWEMSRRSGATMLHPTQKPLAMVQRAIRNSSRQKEIVLDPFGGSGTTLIAADREERAARIIELDPIYCDVIIRRYASLGANTEFEVRESVKNVDPPKAEDKPAEDEA